MVPVQIALQEKGNIRSVAPGWPKAFLALSVACITLVCTRYSGAQSSTIPLPVDALIGSRFFATYDPFAISNDGRWIAYVTEDPEQHRTVHVPDVGTAAISVLDAHTGAGRKLDFRNLDDSMPDWSPDGRYLAFCSTNESIEGKQTKSVSIWDRFSEGHRELFHVDECVLGTFRWAGDSQHIFVRVARPQVHEDILGRPATKMPTTERDRWPHSVGVHVFEAGPAVRDQSTFADPWDITAAYDLVMANVADGRADNLLVDMRIGGFWVSPDGCHVAVALRKRFAQPGSQQLLYDLGLLEVPNRAFKVLVRDVELGPTPFTVSWSPGGEFLAYRSAGMSANGDIFAVALSGGKLLNLTRGAATRFGKKGFAGSVVQLPLWEEKGTSILFASNDTLWRASVEDGQVHALAHFPGKQVETIRRDANLIWGIEGGASTVVIARDERTEKRSFHKVNLASGEQTELFAGDFDVDSPLNMFATKAGDRVLYVAEDSGHSRDLWEFSASAGKPHAITHINPQMDDYRMGSSRIVEWRDLDGRLLHGALLLPSAFEAGKKYPLVVGVYGGHLLSADAESFGFGGCISPINAQLLATRGYAVLCPDAPQTVGSPMLDLAKTVLPGINEVINIGIADPEKVGIMGHSYGGYSVLCLVVQTRRFKAAVMSGGFGDLFSDYGAMDEHGSSFGVAADEKGQGLMDGTPWDFRDRYMENSPFFYLNRVETPLLILHGSADTTVPSFLADQVFVALRRLGKTVSYAQYQGEGHSAQGWTYEDEKDYLMRVLEWFDKYLQQNN